MDNPAAKAHAAIDAIATAEGVDPASTDFRNAILLAKESIDDVVGVLESEVAEAKSAADESDGSAESLETAINQFLDEISRPVGAPRNFDVPKTAAVDRAIVGLFDAVGRKP